MTNTEQWLLIILAAVVIVFLLMGIVLMVLLLKLIKKVRHVADKAGETAENLAGATRAVKNTLLEPSVISKALFGVLSKMVKRRKR